MSFFNWKINQQYLIVIMKYDARINRMNEGLEHWTINNKALSVK
jgi:hypothetical protein